MYSFEMAPSIRQKVDEFTNCEDIAMAFLIAHTIRKPPVRLKSVKERPGGVSYSLCFIVNLPVFNSFLNWLIKAWFSTLSSDASKLDKISDKMLKILQMSAHL